MNFAAMIDHPPLILDSFAGGGGASTGIEMALGRSPDIAINHNPAALALHEANHPETLHLSENVYKVDPLDYVRGRHIGLAWFSPDCKHFSKAKGGKPVERNIRDLAWIIPGWIERIQDSGGSVDVVILENVEEFKTWGPLIETERGLMPCPVLRQQRVTTDGCGACRGQLQPHAGISGGCGMKQRLDQKHARTPAECLEGLSGMLDLHRPVDGTVQRVAGEIPERAASICRPFLKIFDSLGHRPDLSQVEAGAFDQNGRGDFHRTQRADRGLVA